MTISDSLVEDEPRVADGTSGFDRSSALHLWRQVTVEGVRADQPDLSPRQLALMMTVYLSPEPHTVRGLAQTLGIAKPAVVRALDTLTDHGLIRRKRDDKDRRNVLIKPTVRGAVFLSELSERIERVSADMAV